MGSVFSDRLRSEWVASNALAFAIRDRFPVNPGHTLVVPIREITTWFDATVEEQHAILELVSIVKKQLDVEFRPDGYNVGFNAGRAAGQTVPHLHVHVIPRFEGDTSDPRGGVRHVIPGRGNYLVGTASPLATGGLADPFLVHLEPLFGAATAVSIVAAFVQDSGLALLHDHVHDLLERGGRVRLVTGDYLEITQPAALERLLAWSALWSGSPNSAEADPQRRGLFEARVVETASLDPPGAAFHPKGWIFEGPGLAVGFVGSSNISMSALARGVEWNLRTERATAPEAWTRLVGAFNELWASSLPLTADWLVAYERRVRTAPVRAPAEEVGREEDVALPDPHEIQQEALRALQQSRAEGRARALVVMATGLGKTWLAAFDLARVLRESGRFPRTLFVAHRVEILEQAAATFGRMARELGATPKITWYAGAQDDLNGELVFASVQKLALKDGLARLGAERFDYVVVDEVHHATAESYRKILDRLDAGFLLGLTATPDRADEGDIRGLFDDHVALEAGLGEGIRTGLLSPFEYWGIKDTLDYAQIPWRNRRFDSEALAAAAATEARMSRLWDSWQDHAATRSLVFCCSVKHAHFAAEWLGSKGVRCLVVTAETPQAERRLALDSLRDGQLEAVCSVDLFNEGVDVPGVDRIVMLRPTESPVLFVQQLGRGLRRADGKDRLVVLDFVGNHRVFLDRLRLLLTLSSGEVSLRQYLAGEQPELPPGCSVEVELEAKDMLRFFLPRGESEVIRAYRELRDLRGERPRAGELFRMGYLPSTVKPWFDFVRRQDDLTAAEEAAHSEAGDWFQDLETTRMEKSFKMVVLETLLEAGALRDGMELQELARRSHAIIARSPELRRDIEGVARFGDPLNPDPAAWLAYWRENPVRAWTEGPHSRWFRVAGDRLIPRLPVPPAHEEVFAAMTRELVDYRLAQYRKRGSAVSGGTGFTCKVTWNQRDPILKLPRTATGAPVPAGETDVRLPDGSVWRFRFAKEFCNVARPAGKDRNELPDLLRSWFGPAVGKPGTSFHVRFVPSPDGLWIEPVGEKVAAPPIATRVPCYPTLRAAAGAARGQGSPEEMSVDEGPSDVWLPVARPGERLFAVRAAGSSMEGGKDPIHDGDWIVLRWARGEALKNVLGRIALVETGDDVGEVAYQLKRVAREGGRWLLRSDNPGVPDMDASERSFPIALHVQTIRPADLAPAAGTLIAQQDLAAAFGLDTEPRTGRVRGHLFLLVDQPGSFPAPDRLAYSLGRLPGETAYVLTRVSEEQPWRYCGVGRWLDDEELWSLPDLDWETWRALGQGRSASRRLPADIRTEAPRVVTRILETAQAADGWIRAGEVAYRVLGRSPDGGVRVDGGPDGFGSRTVSTTDIGWVLVAHRDAQVNGGLVDEARVNRLRYLEGTPRESTRWIDTKHALALVKAIGAAASPGSGRDDR